VVVDGVGAVSERLLGDHMSGSTLTPPTVKVVSSSVVAGRRTVVMTRPMQAPSHNGGVRCAFFDRNLHSRMTTSLTPLLRLQRCDACDQWHSSRVFTFQLFSYRKFRHNEGLLFYHHSTRTPD
jgi:hypothetical protein